MGKYILRRLTIALPSLLGISLILFILLALAPGDPFGELATNRNMPPEVRAALRVKFGLDDPGLHALLPLAGRDAAGRLGLLVRQPHRRRQADLAAVPVTLFVIGSSQMLALAIALPVGVLRRSGPIRSSTRSPARSPSSAFRCRPSSPASC